MAHRVLHAGATVRPFMTESRPSLLRRTGWLAFAIVVLGLGYGLVHQPVDAENRALKDPGSRDAAALGSLAEVVPDDPVLVVACKSRGELALSAGDRQSLAQLQQHFAALPEVVRAESVPIADPGLGLLAIHLARGDLMAAATAVIAAADRLAPPTVEVLATGLPLLEGTIARLVASERTTIVPVLVAVLLAAAIAFYRRVALAIGVLLPPLCGIACTGGALAWLGHRLDPIAALLDPVLLTIGVAASVHFVEGFRTARTRGLTAAEAVIATGHDLRTPSLLAAATTMLGLWSLTTSSIPAVIDFGLRSALGVALVHLFVFWLLPPWLRTFAAVGPTVPSTKVAAGNGPPLDQARVPAAARAWSRRLRRRRLPLVIGTALATAFSAAGLGRLRADNDPLQMLPASERARTDHDELVARLSGVETCHLLVAARSPASEPARLLPLLAELRQQPGIAGLAGPVLRGADGVLAAPLLLQPAGSSLRTALFDQMEQTARVLGLDDTMVAGPSVQIARDSQRLLQSLARSFGWSALLLAGALVAGLRSLRFGLLALFPNALPALWLYGSLGWLQHPVSVATAMIGCVMLGLIVDNTLHFVHHYRRARGDLAPRHALTAAFARTGPAIHLSSAVLMLGFGSASCSNLSTTVEFALLAVASIGAAWFTTTMILPLLLLAGDLMTGSPHAR